MSGAYDKAGTLVVEYPRAEVSGLKEMPRIDEGVVSYDDDVSRELSRSGGTDVGPFSADAYVSSS